MIIFHAGCARAQVIFFLKSRQKTIPAYLFIDNKFHCSIIFSRFKRGRVEDEIFLTPLHLTFYRQKKAPAPSWAGVVSDRESQISINDLINIQVASLTADKNPFVNPNQNTLNILKSVRRRSKVEMIEQIRKMAVRPGCATGAARRAANCRKWLDRIEGGKAAQAA